MSDVTPGFVHLHNHTTYSLLDGAQRIDEMCARAAEDGQPAIAITDHGNLFGVMEFGKRAAKHGIKPIVGIEAYVAPESHQARQPSRVAGVGNKNYYHLILLAENYAGYKNLIRLASIGYLEGFYYRPRIDKQLLAQHSEGLVCLSACLAGEIPTFLNHDQYDRAVRAAGELRELFGPERFWLELQDHGIQAQHKVNVALPKLARELGLPMVASNDCHYLLPDDHEAHDVLVCISTGSAVGGRASSVYTPQHYLKTRAEMAELFDWAPQAVENTLAIAERCQFAFGKPTLQLPDFPVPAGYDLDGYFERMARDGLEWRMVELRRLQQAGRLARPLEDYRKRLDEELAVIRQMGYSGYFLIVWDFIRFAREAGIPVGPGRGSAAGSLVAYSLRITDIDPLAYNLLFERFLNPERVSMPDIDIDFCFRKREKVIDYVTGKYGRRNVAQIITFGTMAARAVIRDVGRVLEIPYAEVDRIAKLVPAAPGKEVTIDGAMADVPQLKEAYDKEPRIKELLDVARRLEGLTRHASTHAAGVVIAPREIVEFAPLYRGTKDGDEITTQWAKDEIEECGLLKMDFLGLKTLTLIDDALASIERVSGARLDLDGVPLDDEAVYRLFGRARTSGIFQFESEGMKDILRRLKPEKFEDLIALNALYRPGPIGGGLIDEFIKRRHGKVKVEYPHPMLAPILEETYGVIVYQEQVMQIASLMGGYSLGEADILRRAMGKKKAAVMKAEKEKFLERAMAKGIDRADGAKVFELMEYFAGYGFNKSHSAAYALVAFHTAWLKTHYPVHFMAALLTNDKGNTDKLVKYINECREMGIEVLPPDVNASDIDFTVEGERIRFGLSAIKNVGEGAIRAVIEARQREGRFESLHDLCGAVDARQVNKRVLEALVQSGAMDSFGARRSQLFHAIDVALEHGQKQRADREAGQVSLFGAAGETDRPAPLPLDDAPEWDEKTRLSGEKATLGFYVSGHPLESYRDLLEEFRVCRSGALREMDSGTEVAVGGVIADLNRRKSRKGEWWASLQLEDLEGQVEVLVFPKCYKTHEHDLDPERPALIAGRLEIDEDRLRVIADSVCPLDELRERNVNAVHLSLDAGQLDEELVERIMHAVESHRGKAQLYFEVARPGAYRLVALAESSLRVAPSGAFAREIESIVGPNKVRYRTTPLLRSGDGSSVP
ncbi:MAG TPA: DNA polymerase III subunit alpha [Candidatus Polarisedimenticolaceae bacterium]|nr:DNA polymerase III subunit alpha [Candidatus Polarisedimenticolaceae bacterium]